MIGNIPSRLRSIALFIMLLSVSGSMYGQSLPEKPYPPRLVNDMANMLTGSEQAQLEQKLEDFEKSTSNEITIVTIPELGDYDVSDYAIKLGKAWGIGKSGKNNGVVILASLKDHKINISTGKGLEGALTDLTCGRIIRNEMVPAFKEQQYYTGFSKAADAVLAATKGEYKADQEDGQRGRHIPAAAIIIFVIIIIFIVKMMGRGGGGGGGNYISGGGVGNFLTGMFIGNLLSGGRRGGGGWGGGGDWGGGNSGGFGGFGGGDFGGGGASGSW